MRNGTSANKSTRPITIRVDHETADLWEALVKVAAVSDLPARYLMKAALNCLFEALAAKNSYGFRELVEVARSEIRKRREV